MKNVVIYIIVLAAVYALASCEENQMDDYTNDPAVYFYHSTKSWEQADSINFSFFTMHESMIRDTVHVKVSTMGMTAAYDRPVSVTQTNKGEPNAAEGGVHFVAFDNAEVKDSLRIPAHAVWINIPIIVLRHKSLSLQEKRLELALVSNEHFRLGIDAWRTFVVTINDNVTKPKIWDNVWRNYWGPSWGPEKMRFLIKVSGYTEWEQTPADFSYLMWMVATVKQALLEYNLTHPDAPLKEANGDRVTFDS